MGSNKNPFSDLTIYDKLMKNELLKDLKPSILDFDDLDVNLIHLKKNEILYRQGDPTNSIFLVIEGEIKLSKNDFNDKMQSLIFSNGYFGHEEYFLKSNRITSAEANKNSVLVELTKSKIEMILAHDNTFLNTIIDSVLDLNPKVSDGFEHTSEGLPGNPDKLLSQFPMEINLTKQDASSSDQIKNKHVESNLPLNGKKIMRVESGINNIIKNINQSLALLQEEKDKLKEIVSIHEKENQKLLDEISRLREQEDKFINLENEKNSILSKQRNRIIELEKDILNVTKLEIEYTKQMELVEEREEKISQKTKRIEDELIEKDAVISKLNKDFNDNKNIILELNEIVSALTKKADENDILIRRQKATLIESAKEIDSLTSSLSEKEKNLNELKKDLTEKAQLIYSQNEKLNSSNTDKDELNNSLVKKEEKIQALSSKIKDLQIQLEQKKENEKSKNDFIINQSNKISEYEEQINNYKKDILHKDEIIENFIKDIGELSETVSQKQHEINDQNIVVAKLSEEIKNQRNFGKEYITKEAQFKAEINQLKSQLNLANDEVSALKNNVSGELEFKEKENNNLILQLSEVTANFNEEINQLKSQLNSANDEVSALKNNVSGELELKEKENNNLILQLSEVTANLNEEINRLKSQLGSANDEISALRNNATEEKSLIEFKEEENKNLTLKLSDLEANLKAVNKIFDSQKNKINDLENIISDLREKLSDNSELEKLREEINIYKSELLNSQLLVEEKVRTIEEQELNNRNLKESKAAIIKTLTSTKDKYEQDLNNKEIQIRSFKNEIESIRRNLEEKSFNEEQQNIIIDNQAQKIADLEIRVTEVNTGKEKEEPVVDKIVSESYSEELPEENFQEEQIKITADDNFLSQCTLITSESANTFFDDKGLEYFKYTDVNIVNVNLSRATLDVASVFNKFLMEIISKERKKIIVNLTACNYIDSSILGALVSGVKKARTFNGDLRIVFLSQSEYSMFTLTKMDNIFKIFKDLKEAVMSYKVDSE